MQRILESIPNTKTPSTGSILIGNGTSIHNTVPH
jgi:hypothetical protein